MSFSSRTPVLPDNSYVDEPAPKENADEPEKEKIDNENPVKDEKKDDTSEKVLIASNQDRNNLEKIQKAEDEKNQEIKDKMPVEEKNIPVEQPLQKEQDVKESIPIRKTQEDALSQNVAMPVGDGEKANDTMWIFVFMGISVALLACIINPKMRKILIGIFKNIV